MEKQKLIRLIGMVGLPVMLGACSFSVPDEEQVQKFSAQDGEPLVTTEEGTALMSEAGMINVQRHTKDYTISMILDATDDNIYFVMDLPDDEAEDALQDPEAEEETGEEMTEEEAPAKKVEAPAEASKYVLYAQTYFFERKYDRAITEVDRAIEIEPDSAVAYSLKGSIHFKRGETDQAKKAWERSLELDPNQEDVKKMLGSMK